MTQLYYLGGWEGGGGGEGGLKTIHCVGYASPEELVIIGLVVW